MACEEHKKLQDQIDSARQEWAYFTYPENKTLRGTSDRKSKLLAKDAKRKMEEIGKQMQYHHLGCEECKKPTKS
jgi:hypothetical protein